MSDTDTSEDEESGAEPTGRSTAPQSPFGRRELTIGLAVFAVGTVVAFLVPLALA